MGISVPNGVQMGQPWALGPPPRCGAPSRDADGVRGPAQRPISRRNRMGPGVSRHRDVNTRTHAVPHGALPGTLPRFVCPSVLSPSLRPAGSSTQPELSAGHCSIPVIPREGEPLRSGEVGPQLSWGHVPGPSPPLQDSGDEALLRHAHGAAITRTSPPVGGRAAPAPSPEPEVSQPGQTGRLRVQGRKLSMLPCPQHRHFLVASELAHVIPKVHGSGRGRGDRSLSPTPHTGLSGPGRCPSPA